MIPGLQKDRPDGQPAALRIRRVLVVDEALPVRRKLLDILHHAGIASTEVDLAEGSEAALEHFALGNPSLVFAELVGCEPEEGLAMVTEMLAVDPHVKIVLVTAEDPCAPVVRRAIRAGVFAVVAKPLRHEAIRQILAEIEVEEGGVSRFR